MTTVTTNRTLSATMMAVSILAAGIAYAGPGDHVRIGAAELVPSLSMGIGYHSNVFRSESNELPGLSLVVEPSLTLQAEGQETSVSLNADYRTKTFTSDEASSASQYSDFDLTAGLSAYEHSTVGVTVVDTVGLKNSPIEDIGSVDPFSSHFRNRFSVDANLRPGTALEIDLGGLWAYDRYLVPDGAQASGDRTYGSKNTYGPRLSSSWAFFPRTAIVLEGEMNFVRWDENVIEAGGDFQLGEFLIIPDSNNWKLMAGLRGRITKPLVLVFLAGYGSAIYDEESAATGGGALPEADRDLSVATYGDDLEGWDKLLINSQVRYNTGAGNKYTLGYLRDFQDVFFTNYVSFDYVYFKAANRIGSRMGTELGFGGRYENYAGEERRTDILLDASLSLSLFLKDWGQIKLAGGWLERASTDNEVEFDDFRLGLSTIVTY